MNTEQRVDVRSGLLDSNFYRTEYTQDVRMDGTYSEVWQHWDGTKVIIHWGPKTVTPS